MSIFRKKRSTFCEGGGVDSILFTFLAAGACRKAVNCIEMEGKKSISV